MVKVLRLEGSFLRNITISFSGNTVAIVIGFLFTPFIARVYTPEAYGFFAFFVSLTQNIAIVATLQLPRAFVLPESEVEFRTILNFSIVSLCAVVVVTAIFLLFFGSSIFNYFDIDPKQIDFLIYAIPISVLLYSLNDVLKSSNVRRKLFTKNALTQIVSSTVSRSTTLLYGFVTVGNSSGLVFGDLLSKISEIVFIGRHVVVNAFSGISHLKKQDLLTVLLKYRSYPLFMLPGIWMQAIIAQLPVYFALLYFGSAFAGYYSFANSLLNLPVNILAGAIAPVFLQKASETFRKRPSDMSRIVESLANTLFLTALLPMVFLTVFADHIFTFVLGAQWVVSGELASYMGVYFLLLILNYPLTSLYRIYGKEHLSFMTNVLALVLAISALSIGSIYGDFVLAIALFSLAGVIHYLINIFLILMLAGLPPFRIIFKWILYFVIAYSFLSFLRRALEYYWI